MLRVRRLAVSVVALTMAVWGLSAPAMATDHPDLIQIVNDSTITQGTEKPFKVEVLNFVEGGTFVVSGDGVDLIVPNGGIKPAQGSNFLRIKFEASTDATPGLRDLTVINPDGQSDTLVDAIEVLDGGFTPATGLGGHVFSDDDGDGVKDAGEAGLSGVTVDIVDADGAASATTTDSNGDFEVTGIAAGDATVNYTTPADGTLTTGNDVQVVTVVSESIASAADVGYEISGPPPGSVDILGIANANTDLAQGATASYRVDVTGSDAGATWTFSGSGLTITRVVTRTDSVRITVEAAADADLGPHDLTVVNPDGATDTLVDAVTVVAP